MEFTNFSFRTMCICVNISANIDKGNTKSYFIKYLHTQKKERNKLTTRLLRLCMYVLHTIDRYLLRHKHGAAYKIHIRLTYSIYPCTDYKIK